MKYGTFRLVADPRIVEAYCPKHRGIPMTEVQNGFLNGPVFYCKGCDAVYEPKLVKWRESQIDREALAKQLEELKK